MFDRKQIKNSLTDEQVSEILQELGSSPPIRAHNSFMFETVCHNEAGCGSRKLYYYSDSKMFHCYTGCGESFDIFGLIIRAFKQRGVEMGLSQAIYWTYRHTEVFFTDRATQEEVATFDNELKREIKFYDKNVIQYLPFYMVYDWYREGISVDTMKKYEIKFNPVSSAVIIPHFDIDDNLVGVRQRVLAKDDEESLGKYRPAYINGKSYPHPLSFNLYGINYNKDNIVKYKRAIIFEGEKSVLMMDKDPESCAVACCGSNLSLFQVELLVSMGVEEIVIAFDKEFLQMGDVLFEKQVKSLRAIHNRFSNKVMISFMFDKYNLLGYKESPIDRGLDTFNFLFSRRFTLQEEA